MITKVNNMKKYIIFVIIVIFTLHFQSLNVIGCTGFTASGDNTVLVGNNEDYSLQCEPKVMIYPPTDTEYGRILFYNKPYPFNNMPYVEFGGLNEHGLFFDSFSHPQLRPTNPEGKPVYNGWYIPTCLKSCSTVEEELEEFSRWYHPLLNINQILIADRTGDSAIIEGDTIIQKEGTFQVCTNFLQSHPELGGYPCWRYDTAVAMLDDMADLSPEYFRNICDATHIESMYTDTIYSNVYDLTNCIVYLYYMHDYSTVVTFNLSEEFERGTQQYFLNELFDFSENQAPAKPAINGPSSGQTGNEYTYVCSSTDPNRDQIYYLFEWDDGTESDWLGPYISGEEVTASHSWNSRGSYEIKVKAKDVNGAESDWSDPLPISMPLGHLTLLEIIMGWVLQIIGITVS